MITSMLMGCGVFVFIDLLNAVKVSCCNLVVQVVEFDAHKKTKQQESYLGYGLTDIG